MGKPTKLDELGRIVIEKGVREYLGLVEGMRFESSAQDGDVILHPVDRVCAHCGNVIDMDREMQICDDCIRIIQAMPAPPDT